MNSNASAIRESGDSSIFIVPAMMWIVFAVACIAIGVAFEPSLGKLVEIWFNSEEFNYGPLIPFIFAFLIWQQRDFIEREGFEGSWTGVAIVVAGTTLAFTGQMATVPVLAHVGIIAALAGLTLATTGWRVFRRLVGAFGVLLLAVPLPAFLLNTLSLELQLLSSKIGVAIVRMMGISVFLEGNVIDLGVYKLEVAEACSGLRYLFPLLTMGFLMAYMFKVSMWKRVLLFVSSIPITIVMNSIRIGVIGVMVDRWGTSVAVGFMHDFQGWVVFMVSAAVMVAEMILLARIGNHRRPWREVFGLEFPPPRARNALRVERKIHAPLIAVTSFAVAVASAAVVTPKRAELIPSRAGLTSFPSQLSGWTGQATALESVYLDALKLDDYLMADYRNPVRSPVNFYVAWYDSQQSGRSTHSPRSCLPGGGWRIDSLEKYRVPDVQLSGSPLNVNRAVIRQGQQTQLVYYWFQQRGRVVTNEYLVKWYLFWDSLTRNRTDGALVRLVASVPNGASTDAVDATLAEFLRSVSGELPRFIPN